jgi:outer membrane protein TolC
MALGFGTIGSSWASAADQSGRYTLFDCQIRALQINRTLAEISQKIRQREEHLFRAKATWYPTLSVESNVTIQEGTASTVGQEFFPEKQTTLKASVRQNVFKGFLDQAIIRQKILEQETVKNFKEEKAIEVLGETAQIFFAILSYVQNLTHYEQELATHQKRREEIISLKKMGRAREIDVVAIDAFKASLEAEQVAVKGALAIAYEALSFLTGLSSQAQLQDVDAVPKDIHTPEFWLTQISKRPDVQVASQEMELANQGIHIAKASYFPTIDLLGDYFLDRPGIVSDIHWDLMLVLSFNIFEGGVSRSLLREALSYRQEKEIELRKVKEQATRDIRTLFQALSSSLAQAEKLSLAKTYAQKKYDLLSKENRMGLATNMEVLESLALIYQVERALSRTQYSAKNEFEQLQIATISGDIHEKIFLDQK